MGDASMSGRVRLAELVAALSLGIDLGFGQPMEHVLRQCLIALRLAERIGLEEQERAAVYYTSLLFNVGCHSDAHEQAKWFGDDIGLKADKYNADLRSLRSSTDMLKRLGAGGDSPLHRFRVGIAFAVSGHKDLSEMIRHHAGMARTLAEQLGLPESVQVALGASYERWDGRGWPGELEGDDVPIASRLASIAEYVEVAHRIGCVDAAKTLARERSGKQFDPQLSAAIEADGEMLLAGLDEIVTWNAVIDAEPALGIVLREDDVDGVLTAIADFIDLKSPFTLGHARNVAALVGDAAEALGLPGPEARTLRRAGLVHDWGRLGVSNSIWDKPGPLGAGEWERIRMHPYLTERMLRQSAALAPLAAIAVQHRERLDGSGYPRSLQGAAISRPARILGAADAYAAMREPRPYRDARSPDDAAAELRAEVKAGRLDADAVEAVLGAAGHRVPRRRSGPAGLTPREIEVLRFLARGLTNKDIAACLFISQKTVANHIEHIYTKIGASTRAAAALFATQQGLLADEEPSLRDPGL